MSTSTAAPSQSLCFLTMKTGKASKTKSGTGSASTVAGSWVEGSGLVLKGHEQFNLYKDLPGETKRLSAYVSKLPKGRIVVVRAFELVILSP